MTSKNGKMNGAGDRVTVYHCISLPVDSCRHLWEAGAPESPLGDAPEKVLFRLLRIGKLARALRMVTMSNVPGMGNFGGFWRKHAALNRKASVVCHMKIYEAHTNFV